MCNFLPRRRAVPFVLARRVFSAGTIITMYLIRTRALERERERESLRTHTHTRTGTHSSGEKICSYVKKKTKNKKKCKNKRGKKGSRVRAVSALTGVRRAQGFSKRRTAARGWLAYTFTERATPARRTDGVFFCFPRPVTYHTPRHWQRVRDPSAECRARGDFRVRQSQTARKHCRQQHACPAVSARGPRSRSVKPTTTVRTILYFVIAVNIYRVNAVATRNVPRFSRRFLYVRAKSGE